MAGRGSRRPSVSSAGTRELRLAGAVVHDRRLVELERREPGRVGEVLGQGADRGDRRHARDAGDAGDEQRHHEQQRAEDGSGRRAGRARRRARVERVADEGRRRDRSAAETGSRDRATAAGRDESHPAQRGGVTVLAGGRRRRPMGLQAHCDRFTPTRIAGIVGCVTAGAWEATCRSTPRTIAARRGRLRVGHRDRPGRTARRHRVRHVRRGGVAPDRIGGAWRRPPGPLPQCWLLLAAAGIPEADRRTAGLDVSPTWEHDGPRSVRTGFTVSNRIAAVVRDLERVGAVLDAGLEAGATGLETCGSTSPFRRGRHGGAAAGGPRRAAPREDDRKAAGGRLGPLVAVAEAGAPVPLPRREARMMARPRMRKRPRWPRARSR